MQNTRQPKNKNLTIRLTENDKLLFEELAKHNDISPSSWAYHILKKHKNSYGKTENIDQLLDGIETVIEGYKFIKESLETEINKSHHNEFLLPKHTELVMRRNDVNIKKHKIIKLKSQIIDSKLS